ncbi:sigma-70 family RNA polymerase sigma factor [Streptomyces sp. NBC_00445]|uniref:sigma-70 family RNA polymerase sigma factor n=1 Tax=unclassified Streptomyces TaxID=2593676 RepID=UPI002E1DECBB|nr:MULTISPECIES: sigma-70 family RNA polymerase sigma factor [unclassified Streptomyces]
MTSRQPDPAGPMTHRPDSSMPPEFWDFQARYDRACFEYSRIHLGGNAVAARRLVDRTFLYLATIWPRLEAMENPGAYAWALFKQRVHGELADQGRSPATTETLAFERAIQAASAPLLAAFRSAFHAEHGAEIAELEEGLGLFRQMTRLSERQFDVLVLRDLLEFDTKHTALIMGIREATVRSTRRTAKHRLAAAMGYPVESAPDDDKE